jgi:predicted ferric reductase
MILIVRGMLWYGLYLFLILLPLGTAALVDTGRVSPPFMVEIAVGAGFVGFALMSLEFALISRIKPAAQPFGEDSLQLFHNLMGGVALGFILLHPILLVIYGYPANCWLNPFSACANVATRTAFFSIVILLLLVGSSLWRDRLRIKYELWYGLHGISALLVLFLALVHIFILGRYTSTTPMKLVWVIYAVLVLGLTIWYKVITPFRNWNRQWEVIENRVERGDAHTLVLKPVGHEGITFSPGQFAWIKSGRTPFGMGQHPISISSLAHDEPGGNVSFTIKNLGDWSGEQVPAIQVGDRVWLDGPHGVFSMDREQAMGYVFVGGGIGITPLYSMLQTMEEREDVRPVVLFYGANNFEDMTLLEELRDLSHRTPNLQAIPVVTNPPDGWDGESGYITAEIMKKYLPKQYRRFKYLICGPKPLMDSMEEALPVLGVPPENVLTERFDMV